MIRNLKILAFSIAINLGLLWLFVKFVMEPVHIIAKAIAEGLLR